MLQHLLVNSMESLSFFNKYFPRSPFSNGCRVDKIHRNNKDVIYVNVLCGFGGTGGVNDDVLDVAAKDDVASSVDCRHNGWNVK